MRNRQLTYRIIADPGEKMAVNAAAQHPLQSWEWGEARAAGGVSVMRVGGYDDNILHEVFTVTLHRIPKTNMRVGYVPRSIYPTRALCDFLLQQGKANNIIGIKFEPYIPMDHDILSPQHIHPRLTHSRYHLFPRWTQTLDLTPSEEDLLRGCKPKTRYNIRYAAKHGVTVREMTHDEGFDIFINLYFETVRRQQYHGHDIAYHRHIFQTLRDSISHILVAQYENEPLAAYHLFHFKDRAYYVYGGSSDLHRNIMGSNLLMWEALLLSKRLGATTFDMWGSLPPDEQKNSPWAGFTRFKEGYGTKYVCMVAGCDLIINPIAYELYQYAYLIRDKMLRLRLL